MMLLCTLLFTFSAAAAAAAAPTGLQVDFKRSPALGVRLKPSFGWIVPACSGSKDHHQVAYQIKVSGPGGKTAWDSGKVVSSASTYVGYRGTTALAAGTSYTWTVTTWTQSATDGDGTAPCESAASAPAAMITSLGESVPWDKAANFIANKNKAATFAYFRKEVVIPADAVSAAAFITATNQDPMLSAYKLYLNGVLVNLGPGRGEAPVWEGDGQFRSLPYYTLDVSTAIVSAKGKSVVVALECMKQGGVSAIMQINVRSSSGKVTTVGTDATWMSFDGDAHRHPGPALHGHSAGTGFLEYIDARGEPVGWMASGFKATGNWTAAVAAPPSTAQVTQLHPKMQPPMEVKSIPVTTIKAIPPSPAPAPPHPHGPPPGPPASCVDVPENQVADIGEVVSSVDFASFGTPSGSCSSAFSASRTCNSNHSMAVVAAACMGKQACSLDASCSTFKERLENPGAFCWDIKKRLAVKVTCKKKSAVLAAPKSPPQLPPCTPSGPRPCTPSGPSSWFLADFGKELTGGMVLEVKNGKAGQTVDITCGESLSGDAVGSNWGWVQQWTLRDGAQTLTQHKYMECRFVTVAFSGTMDLSGFTLSAWKTHYPYYDSDSQFTSSNATLNAVYELSRYTLEAASLDTYTDSNTRERRPYEADGIIAASARMLVQRDVLWPRHSHAWVMNDPTWPVEWKQISPFLGWQDYMATGTPELSLAFMDQMHDRTMLKFLDETGTLATNKMGRHIVDWMPDTPTSSGERDETVGLGEFTASNHMSVSNGFAAQGLNLLSKMVAAGGRADNATTFAAESASLMKNMRDKMFNGSNWCDGICSEVKGASLMMSNMFMLCFGMTPTANVDSAWKIVADWGLEKIGDYGAFWYLMAIAGGYYADDEYDIPDDGTAVITALTKCDRYSWCSGLRDDNLTMTRESWHEGTYSHEWGTSPIVGVVWGVLGVHQTAPGWANFTVKPKIGSLKHVTATVPTIRGFINVTARPGAVEVGVPCNAHATLCVPRSAQEQGALFTPESHQLLLDGREVPAIATGGHLCAAQTLGCGAGGLARHLSAQQRGD